MRQKRKIVLHFWVLTALLCLAGIARGDREMSDAEKKETVYLMYSFKETAVVEYGSDGVTEITNL